MTTPQAPASDTDGPFEKVVPTYERWVHPVSADLAEFVIQHLPFRAGMRVLDVGAGLGNFSIPASARGMEVLAIDNSPAMVAQLQGRLAPFPQSRAELTSLYDLPLAGSRFDATVSLFCAAFMPDALDVIARLVRATKPGGTVCVNSWATRFGGPMFEILYRALQALDVPDAEPTSEGLIRLSEAANLERALVDGGCREVAIHAVPLSCPLPPPKDFLNALDPFLKIVPAYQGLAPSSKDRLQPLIETQFDSIPIGDGGYRLTRVANVGFGIAAR